MKKAQNQLGCMHAAMAGLSLCICAQYGKCMDCYAMLMCALAIYADGGDFALPALSSVESMSTLLRIREIGPDDLSIFELCRRADKARQESVAHLN